MNTGISKQVSQPKALSSSQSRNFLKLPNNRFNVIKPITTLRKDKKQNFYKLHRTVKLYLLQNTSIGKVFG